MSKFTEIILIVGVIAQLFTGISSVITGEYVSPVFCFLSAIWTFLYLISRYTKDLKEGE
jgi:hypothetical protein